MHQSIRTHFLTGKDLKERRIALGLTQEDVANVLGCHATAIGYWEKKETLAPKNFFCGRFTPSRGFLWKLVIWYGGAHLLPKPSLEEVFRNDHQQISHGKWWQKKQEKTLRKLNKELARSKSKKTRQPLCGAMTRKGTPCQRQALPNKTRCRNHGGLSTGPKTQEGRRRIAEAQQKRWAKHNC